MNLIAVTNRKLCRNEAEFLERIRILADTMSEQDAILLREKDMNQSEYLSLAEKCAGIIHNSPVRFILHTHVQPGLSRFLHLPLPLWKTVEKDLPKGIRISTSVHSRQQLHEALPYQPSFLIAGHIYKTACKEGLQPRGTAFLADLCGQTDLPVFAIGGISAERIPEVKQAGAAGICIMSHLMTCDDLPGELRRILSAVR